LRSCQAQASGRSSQPGWIPRLRTHTGSMRPDPGSISDGPSNSRRFGRRGEPATRFNTIFLKASIAEFLIALLNCRICDACQHLPLRFPEIGAKWHTLLNRHANAKMRVPERIRPRGRRRAAGPAIAVIFTMPMQLHRTPASAHLFVRARKELSSDSNFESVGVLNPRHQFRTRR
jgi:hypothetical protein